MEVFINQEQFNVISSAIKSINTPYIFWFTLISNVLLFATAIFAWRSASASAKSAKYAVMPSALFFPRSAKTICLRTNKDFSELSEDEKLYTELIVLNSSKFPILFFVEVVLKSADGVKVEQKQYWKEPLHIMADGKANYPDIIKLTNFKGKHGEVIAEFKFSYTPRFAPKEKIATMHETWRFDLAQNIWRGPAGIEDTNILLPGEKMPDRNS
ncbi:MAG: hypothetical protein Q7R49_05690 [Candidatus Daviesbacteria bacterium]|nr:hypothetical protein [Candidatus Daviesbacteria bacterium]